LRAGDKEGQVYNVASDRGEQPLLAEDLEDRAVGGVDVAEAHRGRIVAVRADLNASSRGSEPRPAGTEKVRWEEVGRGKLIGYPRPS
jgi:hypothetical protein